MDFPVRSAFVVVALLSAGCGSTARKVAPDFRVERAEIPVKEVKLSSFRGKVVILDFWATWCAPCRETMPKIEKLYQKFRERGVEVVAVSAERRAEVRGFRARSGVSYPFYVDIYRDANAAFNIVSIPQLFIIDKKGRIALQETGSDFNEKTLIAAIENCLAEP